MVIPFRIFTNKKTCGLLILNPGVVDRTYSFLRQGRKTLSPMDTFRMLNFPRVMEI